MEKAHKDLIDQAINKCKESNDLFMKHCMQRLHQTELTSVKNILASSTFFAGSVFRNTFIGQPVNDIKMYFSDGHAAEEFKRIFYSPNVGIFQNDDITDVRTLIWKKRSSGKYNTEIDHSVHFLHFVTENPQLPEEWVESTAFSFDKHYFKLNNFSMRFDLDTFSKKGYLKQSSRKPYLDLALALDLLNKGMHINGRSILQVIEKCRATGRGIQEDMFSSGYLDECAEITENWNSNYRYDSYTEEDYFGVKSTETDYKTYSGITLSNGPSNGPSNWTNTTAPTAALNTYDRQRQAAIALMAQQQVEAYADPASLQVLSDTLASFVESDSVNPIFFDEDEEDAAD